MSDIEKNKEIDLSTIYQVAAERFNVIHQQSQTAISISTVSVMAFGAAIGAIFASMASARDVYRFYADWFIIAVSLLAIVTSIVCKRILDRTSKVVQRYEDKLMIFESHNGLLFKPHKEFYGIWKQVFRKYEPYKMTSRLLAFSVFLYAIFIIAAIANICYLLIVLRISLW